MQKRILFSFANMAIYFFCFKLFAQGYVFGPNIRISDYTPGTAYAYTANAGQRGVAVRGDTVYCAWSDGRTGAWGVWFSKSIDGGQTFSANVQVDDGLGAAYTPTIALGGDGTIYVAWDGEPSPFDFIQVFFSRSTDGGITFTPDVVVNDTAGGIKNRPHRKPSMAVDTAGVIYIAFDDWRNVQKGYDIYFSKSTDGGLTFTPDVLVNDTVPVDTLNDTRPALAISDNGDIYVSWSKAFMWLYVSKSTDGGMTFGSDILVNDMITESWMNTMDVDARGYVHIAWFDFRDVSSNIYYARSTDGGMTFTPDIRLNDAAHEPAPQAYPSLCVDDSGMVYAVWENGSAVWPDIFFTLSTDIEDTSFVEPNVLIDETDSSCFYPSITVGDSGQVYVMWVDFRIGWPFNDVYFSVGHYESGIEEVKERELVAHDFEIVCSPNPFVASTNIKLQHAGKRQRTKLLIYDVAGRTIRSFAIDGSEGSGITWDGTDPEGKVVPAGIYFIQATTGTQDIRTKIIKVK